MITIGYKGGIAIPHKIGFIPAPVIGIGNLDSKTLWGLYSEVVYFVHIHFLRPIGKVMPMGWECPFPRRQNGLSYVKVFRFEMITDDKICVPLPGGCTQLHLSHIVGTYKHRF